MRQYRKLLLEKCLYALRDACSTSVPSEGMEALTKLLAELREGDIGSFFNAISEQCRSFFDNVSPDKSLAFSSLSKSQGLGGGCADAQSGEQKGQQVSLGANGSIG